MLLIRNNYIRLDFFTYFPSIYPNYFSHSFFLKLQQQNKLSIDIYGFFEYSKILNYVKIDSKPFGGNKGLILRYDFISDMVKKVYGKKIPIIIHPSPSGQVLTQDLICSLSKMSDHFMFVNSRYEGIDCRFAQEFCVIEISIGDYILYDGDTASMVIANALIRYNNVKEVARINESFDDDLLEHDQYGHPDCYNNLSVPSVLKSGNHKMIKEWQLKNSQLKTKLNRPDLIDKHK